MVWRAAPGELRRITLLTLVFGAGPVVVLYLGKVVIDRAAELAREGQAADAVGRVLIDPVILWSVVGFVIINVLLDCVETLEGFEVSSLIDRVQGSARSLVYEKVAAFDDISLFEDPEALNAVRMAEQAIPRLQRLAMLIGNLLTGLFAFVPVFVLSFSIAWWVPLLILSTAGPSILAQTRYEKRGWDVESMQAGRYREMDLQGRVLTGLEYAKELRLLGLQPFVLGRWRDLFWSSYDEVRRVRRRGALVVVGWSLLSGFGAGLPYVYVVAAAIGGSYTLGDLALYAGLIFQVRRSLFVLVANATDLQDVALSSTAIYRLLDMRPALKEVTAEMRATKTAAAPGDIRPGSGIEIEGVSFSYPGGDRRILEDVNLAIGPGETVVVVGENGAGKTTLAKLLCRLYDPKEGRITYGGTDVRAFDLDAWRANIAVVNQDYARFPASARENIAFGLLSRMDDERRIRTAAERAGIAETIERLPEDLDTPLSKQLENGIDLSGGQWQRIAIARALVRSPESKLMILDEPTAALDAEAEHEILGILREMTRNKMALVVSHRLSLARDADTVVVMEKGRVVEVGTHEDLMAAGGRYCAMFTRQASSYAD